MMDQMLFVGWAYAITLIGTVALFGQSLRAMMMAERRSKEARR